MIQYDRSFRLVCDQALVPLAEELLASQGFIFEPDPLLPEARLLKSGPLPLGSSFAARFGLLYIQDRSSMLPPLALAPPPGASVLDMCASPGGKSGMLGLMVGDTGFVLANEPSPKRLGTLRRNLQAQNLFCCATSCLPGEAMPLPGAGAGMPTPSAGTAIPLPSTGTDRTGGAPYPGWGHILLDPPCSGWGTADKNPQVSRLWQGEKIAPLAALQRRLLSEAARLLRPGGLLSYSTCTTNVEENEDQILFARRELGLELVPLAPPSAFPLAAPDRPGCDGVWRVERGPHGQGFFVALLRKAGETQTVDEKNDGASARWDETGHGAAPRAMHDARDKAGHGASGFADSPADERRHTHARGNNPEKGAFFERPWEAESRFVGERRRHGGKSARREQRRDRGEGPRFLDREALSGPCLDPALLPPGELAVFNDVIHFLPPPALHLLPQGFPWKGFPLGRVGKGGEARPFGHLRRLMPRPVPKDAAALVLEDSAPLDALFSGRGLTVDSPGQEIGLYYKELPLCRLSVKGGRALLPAG